MISGGGEKCGWAARDRPNLYGYPNARTGKATDLIYLKRLPLFNRYVV